MSLLLKIPHFSLFCQRGWSHSLEGSNVDYASIMKSVKGYGNTQQYFIYILVVSLIDRTPLYPDGNKVTTLVEIGTDCIGRWKSSHYIIPENNIPGIEIFKILNWPCLDQ